MWNTLRKTVTGALLLAGLGACLAIEGGRFTPELSAEAMPESAERMAADVPTATASVEAETQKLYSLLNAYRKEKGLAPIPYSAKLAKTALTHAQDLMKHQPHKASGPNGADCNLHSWSDQGHWTPVCYTSDHRQAQKMWSKPREVAGYKASGFEISAYATGCHTAACWLKQWKNSPGHNQVMVNGGIWAKHPWKAVGIGIAGDFANIWFGEVSDP